MNSSVMGENLYTAQVLYHLVMGHYEDREWFTLGRIVKLVPDVTKEKVDAVLRKFIKHGWIEGYPEYAPGQFRIKMDNIKSGLHPNGEDQRGEA